MTDIPRYENRNITTLEEYAELLGFEPCLFMYLDNNTIMCHKRSGEVSDDCGYECENFRDRLNVYCNRECYEEKEDGID